MKKKKLKIKAAAAIVLAAPLVGSVIMDIPSNNIVLLVNNNSNQNVNNEMSTIQYQSVSNNITLYGKWSKVYKVSDMLFNLSSKKININNNGNKYFGWKGKQVAYKISLLNNSGQVIKSETYENKESNTALYNDFQRQSFNFGDYIEIVPNKLDVSYNNGALTTNSKTYEITAQGLKIATSPKVILNNNKLTINSAYKSGQARIFINNKKYSRNIISGETTFTLPSQLPIGAKIKVLVKSNDVTTMPTYVYSTAINSSENYSFNMYREASIAPNSKLGQKGNCMTLTSKEPLPIEFFTKGKIKINITGSARLYLETSSKMINLGIVNANEASNINIPEAGTLILDTGNIDSNGNQYKGFKFKVNTDVLSGYHKTLPIFDNRSNVRIDSGATSSSEEFLKEITKPQNINTGAIIIGDHVRIYVPSASNLGLDFNAGNVVKWYNEAFVSDNLLDGLSENSTNELNKFHTNFFFVTTSTKDFGDGWFTGNAGTTCIPGMFSPGLTKAGWIMFHEVGHIFDPGWASHSLGCEVYSNMYTMETQIMVEGNSTWLWRNDKQGYEDKKILPIFEGYYNGSNPEPYLYKFSQGLYYFNLLKEYFPDYMPKINSTYREQWYNNFLPFKGVNYLAYVFAKAYHVNIIPSLNMWGNKVTNQSLIKYVIDNSNKTVSLVPKDNVSFNIYRDITVAPTILNPVNTNNKVIIVGKVNPNAVVTVEYANKEYKTTCDAEGNFTITFNKDNNAKSALIYAKEENKKISLKELVTINGNYLLNNKTFELKAHGAILAELSMNPNGTLNFISTNKDPNWRSKINTAYMSYKIINKNGEVIGSQTIDYHGNFAKAEEELNNIKLANGDMIIVTSPNTASGANVSYSTLSNNEINKFESKSINEGLEHEWQIIVTNNGLEGVSVPKLEFFQGEKVVTGTIDPDAKFIMLVNGNLHRATANSEGQFTLTLSNELIREDKVSYGVIINGQASEMRRAIVSGKKVINNSKITSSNKIINNKSNRNKELNINIENIWKQPLGNVTLNRDTMKINVKKGWSEVNPYFHNTAFIIKLENKDGKVLKSLTAKSKEHMGKALYNEFNNERFNYGDRLVIDYIKSSKITIDGLNTQSGIVDNYKVSKPVTININRDGFTIGSSSSSLGNNELQNNYESNNSLSQNNNDINPKTTPRSNNSGVLGNITQWINSLL